MTGRNLLAVVVALAVLGVVPAVGPSVAEAKTAKSAKRGSKPKGSTQVCTTNRKTKKKTCRRVAIFSGHGVSQATLRTEALERPSGEVVLKAPNLDEDLAVNIYRPDGSFDEAALAELDEIFRCKRTDEVRAVDPRVYEMLSRVYDHFGKRPVELVSGFRFAERNSSRHFHASAMDITIPGVSIREMYAFAESLDAGGMGIGIYPNSGFVHVDFRAPGEPSYRWTDRSGGSSPGKGKAKGRTKPARKPTS
jgi:uncharacterized protein YcbK (DUF882 family)